MPDEHITAQPGQSVSPELQRQPLPDFRLLPKTRAPAIFAYVVLVLLLPVILCSGLLSLPTDNRDYREYLRPMNEFFSKVMWCGIGLFVGLVAGIAVGKASQ